MILFEVFIAFTLCFTPVFLWDNHTVSTLRLLQIVVRHGDRTITQIYPKDPFRNLTEYWFEGLGELTAPGKYRMYKLGETLRQQYQQFLGSNYSPREVYARSSAKSRCLESLSSLLSAFYPPDNDQWKWDNKSDPQLGSLWQPIPIYTVPFDSMNSDRLLRTEAFCPKVDQEMARLENRQYVQNIIRNESKFLQELSQLVGVKQIRTLLDCKNVYDHLITEYERGYKWSDSNIWSPEYEKSIFERLLPLTELLWFNEWNSTVVQRLRAGPLIEELTKNMKQVVVSSQNSKKVYLYSTHDSMIALLLHSLQVFNNKTIPLSASLLFELHENPNNEYFLKIYYFNDTLSGQSPHLLRLPKCDFNENCSINQFFELSEQLIPEDWDKECQFSSAFKNTSFLLILILFCVITCSVINRTNRTLIQN